MTSIGQCMFLMFLEWCIFCPTLPWSQLQGCHRWAACFTILFPPWCPGSEQWKRMKPVAYGREPWGKVTLVSLSCFSQASCQSDVGLHLESGTAIFLTSWGCHSPLPKAFIVMAAKIWRVFFVAWLMSPSLNTIQTPPIKACLATLLSLQNCNVNFLLPFHADSGKVSGHNSSVLCIFSLISALNYRLEKQSVSPIGLPISLGLRWCLISWQPPLCFLRSPISGIIHYHWLFFLECSLPLSSILLLSRLSSLSYHLLVLVSVSRVF